MAITASKGSKVTSQANKPFAAISVAALCYQGIQVHPFALFKSFNHY
jgi:hypothetical protein